MFGRHAHIQRQRQTNELAEEMGKYNEKRSKLLPKVFGQSHKQRHLYSVKETGALIIGCRKVLFLKNKLYVVLLIITSFFWG